MNHVKRRACCATFPGMKHTRVCEARRDRGRLPQILVIRCANLACRVLSFDGAIEDAIQSLPCPSCGHQGEPIRNGLLSN